MTEIIGIVPARSGSKGIPHKNLKTIAGKTLIEHAVTAGLYSQYISSVYISTDSEEYQDVAVRLGALTLGLRKEELSSDEAKTADVLKDFSVALNLARDTILVLLQPTSPLREVSLIDQAILMTIDNSESTVSVAEIDEPHPFKAKAIINGSLMPFFKDSESEIPRQKLPKAYQLTGSVYVSRVDSLINSGSLFSQFTNPIIQNDFVNIDSENDLEYLRYLVDKRKVIFEWE